MSGWRQQITQQTNLPRGAAYERRRLQASDGRRPRGLKSVRQHELNSKGGPHPSSNYRATDGKASDGTKILRSFHWDTKYIKYVQTLNGIAVVYLSMFRMTYPPPTPPLTDSCTQNKTGIPKKHNQWRRIVSSPLMKKNRSSLAINPAHRVRVRVGG